VTTSGSGEARSASDRRRWVKIVKNSALKIKRYDPLKVPAPEQWLDINEAERLRLVEGYHRHARVRLDLEPWARGDRP